MARSNSYDTKCWLADGSGEYTSKSGYRLLLFGNLPNSNQPNETHKTIEVNFFTKLWDLHIPQKIKMHLWKTYKDYDPTYGNLLKRYLHSPDGCPMCNDDLELVDHIFRFCPFTIQVLDSLKI